MYSETFDELYFESSPAQVEAYNLLMRHLNKIETAKKLSVVTTKWRLKNPAKDYSKLKLVVSK